MNKHWRVTAALAAVLGLILFAACGEDATTDARLDEEVTASTLLAPTTSPGATAAQSAAQACEVGDTSTRSGFDDFRAVLAAEGIETAGMSDDELIEQWQGFVEKVGTKRAHELQLAAALDTYETATRHAAKAAALDDRWGALHGGLSNYASYLGSEFAEEEADTVDKWFTDIRLACEQARALQAG